MKPEKPLIKPAENSITINPEILDLFKTIVDCANTYETITKGKRRIGITGEYGEIYVCHKYGLKLILNSISEGYDAIDNNGLRVQIKARKSESGKRLRDLTRLSTFSRHEFDYCLLLLFEKDYQPYEIWKASYLDLLPVIERERRRNPSLGSFKHVAKRIFPESI